MIECRNTRESDEFCLDSWSWLYLEDIPFRRLSLPRSGVQRTIVCSKSRFGNCVYSVNLEAMTV